MRPNDNDMVHHTHVERGLSSKTLSIGKRSSDRQYDDIDDSEYSLCQ